MLADGLFMWSRKTVPLGKRDEQLSCGGRWKSCEPGGHGMPCPYDQRGICHFEPTVDARRG